MSDKLVVDLAEAGQEPAMVGGKAYVLGRLLSEGFPVPGGAVVTVPAFQLFLEHGRLRARIGRELARVTPGDVGSARAAARRIEALVRDAPIPAEVLEALARWRGCEPTHTPLAVRSSAVGEDSEEASFAGQLSSVLGVVSDRELEAALRRCWSSYWSERVVAYQDMRGVALAGMGVIVQRLVPARLAGVLFTRSPVASLDDGCMVAEFCEGTGERLVSGEVDPGRFLVERGSLAVRRVCAPAEPRSADLPAAEAMLYEGGAAGRIAQLGARLEDVLRAPQDVEWALDAGGNVHVLQSRPITGPAPRARPQGASGEVVWSNANVCENYPAAVSPFLFSIAAASYEHYFRNLGVALGVSRDRVRRADHLLRHLVGTHGARLYYNLTHIHALLRLLPLGHRWSAAFDAFVGTEGPDSPDPARARGGARARISQGWALARMATRGTWHALRLDANVARFEREVDHFCEGCDAALGRGPELGELLPLLHGFLEIRLERWTGAALADTAAMLGSGAVRALVARWFPHEERASIEAKLLGGLGAVASSAPLRALWDFSRLVAADARLARLVAHASSERVLRELDEDDGLSHVRSALRNFLHEWGFRGPGELMLTVPGFEEEPARVIDLLRSYAAMNGPSPQEALRRQRGECSAGRAAVFAALSAGRTVPWVPSARAHLLRAVLTFTQRALALRERARLKQSRLYSRCRRIALAIGARLVEAGRLERREDVFLFTLGEVESIVTGGALLPDRLQDEVRWRRARQDALAAVTPPDRVVARAGQCDGGREVRPATGDASAPGVVLEGVGACGGEVMARAAVLADPAEAHRVRSGDVLVTRQTDPAWGPIFFLIKGLVLERGGILSHGAVLARELGIPTVVGVPDATRRIRDGASVRVDGERGRVTSLA